MTIETIHNILQWATLINIAVLFTWFLVVTVAHDVLYRMYNIKFKVSVDQFDVVNYAGLTIFKILVVVFNIAPLLALYIIR